MKTVATFSTSLEAHMLRAQLEGSGIESFVQDDDTVTADWMLSNAIGGVKVQVPESEYDSAMQLISDFRSDEINKAKHENKKRHQVSRYLKIGAAAFFVCLIYMLATNLPLNIENCIFSISTSLFLGGLIGVICAFLDI